MSHLGELFDSWPRRKWPFPRTTVDNLSRLRKKMEKNHWSVFFLLLLLLLLLVLGGRGRGGAWRRRGWRWAAWPLIGEWLRTEREEPVRVGRRLTRRIHFIDSAAVELNGRVVPPLPEAAQREIAQRLIIIFWFSDLHPSPVDPFFFGPKKLSTSTRFIPHFFDSNQCHQRKKKREKKKQIGFIHPSAGSKRK